MLRAAACLVLGSVVCLGAPASAAVAATEHVELGGAPIVSSTDPGSPTLLTAGVWADVLGAATSPDARHEFAYVRTIADSTIHVGVVGAPGDPDGSDGLHVEAAAPGDVSCGSDDSTSAYPVTQRLLGVQVAIGATELGDRNADCLVADEITFSVDRGYSSSGTELSIAIRIVEEAPVEDGESDLPAPPESPGVTVPEPQEATTPVEGRPSLDDAPRLSAGTTYDDTVTEGETLLYRVHVDWGQTLAARVDLPRQDVAEDEAVTEPDLQLVLLDPLRAELDGEVEQSAGTGSYAGDSATRLVEGLAPLGYRNRFDDVAASLPGDYWIAVAAAQADDGGTPVDVPFTLVAEVTGQVEGRPTYPATVQAPGGGIGPAGYSAATPYLLAAGVFAADVPAGSTARDAGSARARDHLRLGAGIALGAVSLGCCAAGIALLRRRSTQVA